MYYIGITKTSAPRAGAESDEFEPWDTEEKKFDSREEMVDFLKRRYPNKSHSKMHQDLKNGDTVHTGYIFNFWNSGMGDKWYQRDWVNIRRVEEDSRQINGGFSRTEDVYYLNEEDIQALIDAGVVASDAK